MQNLKVGTYKTQLWKVYVHIIALEKVGLHTEKNCIKANSRPNRHWKHDVPFSYYTTGWNSSLGKIYISMLSFLKHGYLVP